MWATEWEPRGMVGRGTLASADHCSRPACKSHLDSEAAPALSGAVWGAGSL